MIEIRGFFSDWHPATKEEAVLLARFIYLNMTASSIPKEKLETINRDHIKGITITKEMISW